MSISLLVKVHSLSSIEYEKIQTAPVAHNTRIKSKSICDVEQEVQALEFALSKHLLTLEQRGQKSS